MTDPITTMIVLTDELCQLDLAQTLVDIARAAHSLDQQIQLELDRRQTDINRKRRFVQLTIQDIVSRN